MSRKVLFGLVVAVVLVLLRSTSSSAQGMPGDIDFRLQAHGGARIIVEGFGFKDDAAGDVECIIGRGTAGSGGVAFPEGVKLFGAGTWSFSEDETMATIAFMCADTGITVEGDFTGDVVTPVPGDGFAVYAGVLDFEKTICTGFPCAVGFGTVSASVQISDFVITEPPEPPGGGGGP